MQNFNPDNDRQYVSDWHCRCTSNDAIFPYGSIYSFWSVYTILYLFVQNPESDYGFVWPHRYCCALRECWIWVKRMTFTQCHLCPTSIQAAGWYLLTTWSSHSWLVKNLFTFFFMLLHGFFTWPIHDRFENVVILKRKQMAYIWSLTNRQRCSG